MRRSFPLLSLSLAGSLVVSSLVLATPAHAGQVAAATATADEVAPEDPALAEARELYKEGEVSFQTGEFNAALAMWKRAFALLPDGQDTRAIRHALVYNIAEAHSRAYEVSRNPTHLRTAKVMLENYRKDHLVLYGEESEAVRERSEVDDRIAELDKTIAASVAANEQAYALEESGGAAATTPAPTPAPAGDPGQPMPQPTPKPLTPQQQWEQEVKADPVLGPKWEKSNKRIVGGAILTGIGLPFAGLSLALFVGAARTTTAANAIEPINPLDPTDDFADAGATFLWVGGGVTGVLALGLLIPGGIFLGQGISGRKQVLSAKPKPTSSLTPSFNRRGAGFNYTLRF